LNSAESFIVQGLLSEQKNDEALAKAHEFFEDAVQRYAMPTDGSQDVGVLPFAAVRSSNLVSNLHQRGMPLADAESTLTECRNIATVGTVVDFVQEAVLEDVARLSARAEAERIDLELRLDEYSLEEWQEYYPEASSKEDLRRIEILRRVLEYDGKAVMFERLDSGFVSLFTTTVRIKSGNAKKCLAEALLVHPKVAEMTPAERKINMPNSTRFLEEYLVE
jgi:hypothetical protein